MLPLHAAELRPLVPLDSSRFATFRLNDLPARDQPQQPVERLLELKAPDVIVRNEERCCRKPWTACSTTARGKAMTAPTSRMKSLADVIGKGRRSTRTCSASASILRRAR